MSAPRAADGGLIDRQRRHACRCWQPKARSLCRAHGEWVSIGMETQVYFISLPRCKGESAWETQREREMERERPPQSLCSQLWWRPTQALESSANGFLMPANSRGIYWDGWRVMVKDGRDGERMRVTTMFGREVPADHYCNTTPLSADSSAVWGSCCYRSQLLKLRSFLCLQPHLSWSRLHIFLEVLLFFPRLTQMKSQLCGNHRRNCLYCSTIYRWMSSWLLIMHSLKFNLYAVEECRPKQA